MRHHKLWSSVLFANDFRSQLSEPFLLGTGLHRRYLLDAAIQNDVILDAGHLDILPSQLQVDIVFNLHVRFMQELVPS